MEHKTYFDISTSISAGLVFTSLFYCALKLLMLFKNLIIDNINVNMSAKAIKIHALHFLTLFYMYQNEFIEST